MSSVQAVQGVVAFCGFSTRCSVYGGRSLSDASICIMMRRRTTVSAPADALTTLEGEARRRGTSLSMVLSEAVEEKAVAIRTARRPRVGLGQSDDGQSAAKLTAEPVARDIR